MNQPGWDGGQHGPLIHGANGQGWGPLAGVPLHVLQQPGLLPTPQNPFMMAQAPAAPLNMKKNNKRKAADMEETGPKRKAYKQESAGGSGLASCMALAGGGAPGLGGAGLFPPGISFEGSLVGVPQNPMSQFYEGQALFQQGHGLPGASPLMDPLYHAQMLGLQQGQVLGGQGPMAYPGFPPGVGGVPPGMAGVPPGMAGVPPGYPGQPAAALYPTMYSFQDSMFPSCAFPLDGQLYPNPMWPMQLQPQDIFRPLARYAPNMGPGTCPEPLNLQTHTRPQGPGPSQAGKQGDDGRPRPMRNAGARIGPAAAAERKGQQFRKPGAVGAFTPPQGVGERKAEGAASAAQRHGVPSPAGQALGVGAPAPAAQQRQAAGAPSPAAPGQEAVVLPSGEVHPQAGLQPGHPAHPAQGMGVGQAYPDGMPRYPDGMPRYPDCLSAPSPQGSCANKDARFPVPSPQGHDLVSSSTSRPEFQAPSPQFPVAPSPRQPGYDYEASAAAPGKAAQTKPGSCSLAANGEGCQPHDPSQNGHFFQAAGQYQGADLYAAPPTQPGDQGRRPSGGGPGDTGASCMFGKQNGEFPWPPVPYQEQWFQAGVAPDCRFQPWGNGQEMPVPNVGKPASQQ